MIQTEEEEEDEAEDEEKKWNDRTIFHSASVCVCVLVTIGKLDKSTAHWSFGHKIKNVCAYKRNNNILPFERSNLLCDTAIIQL